MHLHSLSTSFQNFYPQNFRKFTQRTKYNTHPNHKSSMFQFAPYLSRNHGVSYQKMNAPSSSARINLSFWNFYPKISEKKTWLTQCIASPFDRTSWRGRSPCISRSICDTRGKRCLGTTPPLRTEPPPNPPPLSGDSSS